MKHKDSCFIFVDNSVSLERTGSRVMFYIWNAMALILSSATLCGVSLNFAIGDFPLFYIYLGYFKNPSIFLLNWIPVLLVQIVLFALVRRQWIAFLLNNVFNMLPSIGNYYKLKFRSDPFTFEDISSVKAGLTVAKDYDIVLNWRIGLAVAFIIAGTVILFFFARWKPKGVARLIAIVLALTSIWPLWTRYYANNDLYYVTYMKNYVWIAKDERDKFIATGFQYPFLHSITASTAAAPADYDEKETEKLLGDCQNANIPEDEKINILVIQLESFCDMAEAGIPDVPEKTYEVLHQLQQESQFGMMIANVIGGGTITTERCVLTGNYKLMDYHKPAYSYVRYFQAQGYYCYSTHPNDGTFYARRTTNLDLGFSEHYSLDNYYQGITEGKIQCDKAYLPDVFRMFREYISEEAPVFSFNVSWQGHFPYSADIYTVNGEYWNRNDVSPETNEMLNNYFGSIMETQEVLQEELLKLKDETEPVVVLLYGDHKPWFGDEIYQELEISFDMETEKEMERYLGTPYLIWTNDASRDRLKGAASDELPTVSPDYLLNVLFEQLGWKGPAFMQITDQIRSRLPVICTRGGYIEDGEYRRSLSEDGQSLKKIYDDLQYYLRYRPELAAS